MRCLVVCALLAFCAISSISAKEQKIRVTGIAVCNKKRLPNVKVVLKEKDTLTPDDTLAETTTDRDGEFTISGQDSEIFSIEPYLVFHHDCNVKKPGCTRETKFEIPKSKIDGTYEMTYVTLDIVQYEDKNKC